MRRLFVAACVTAVCAIPLTASAQEKGKLGVTMGFPAAAGLLWHASEKVAVRPEFSFTHSSTDTAFGDASSDNFGLGFSLLFYTAKWDTVSAYVAPRFAWTHSTGHSESDVAPFENDSSADSYAYSGSFGAQAWFGSRFSVYGELGLTFSHGSADSSISTVDTTAKGFSIRSGVGAVFYF